MKLIRFEKICEYDADIDHVVCIYQNEWNIRRHSWNYLDRERSTNGLIYIASGGVTYTDINGEKVSAGRGDVLYLPKHSRYFADFIPDVSRSLLLNFDIFHHGEECVFSDSVFLVARDRGELLYDMFDGLCDLYARTSDKLLIKSRLYHALSELSKCGMLSESSSPINAAVAYINNHINSDISVTTLARLCAMSESTFRRAFNEAVGCGPKKYIDRQRLEKAKYMLKSELTIGEICSALGYCDVAYFTKLFKASQGVTPAAYKKEFCRK